MKNKLCLNCNTRKPLSEFYRAGNAETGQPDHKPREAITKENATNFCVDCNVRIRDGQRRRRGSKIRARKELRERKAREETERRKNINQYSNRKAITQNSRARRNNILGELTGEEIRIQLKSQNGRCWWCGRLLEQGFEPDHRIPLNKGGLNTARNIVLSCKMCNRSKNDRMPWEWIGRLL